MYDGVSFEEDKLLAAKVSDAIRLCMLKSTPRFVGFLNERQGAIVSMVAKSKATNFKLYGGYDSAERAYFGVFPDWCQNENYDGMFPISAVTLHFRNGEGLSHRDFLGALMGLGIKRESVGDILVEDSRAVIFLNQDICVYVLTQLDKVGSAGIKIEEGITGSLPQGGGFLSISSTVPSPRLDAVISALLNTSRGKIEELIISGLVSIDSLPCEKVTKEVLEGSVIKIRGSGKFIVDSLSKQTKKGRLIINARKYL